MEAVISKFSFTDGKAMFGKFVSLYLSAFIWSPIQYPLSSPGDKLNSRQPIQFNLCLIGGNRSDYLSWKVYTHKHTLKIPLFVL